MTGQRSLHQFVFVLMVATATSGSVCADDIARLRPTITSGHLALWADDVYEWKEGSERVYVLNGHTWIQVEGDYQLQASRAVIWLDDDALRKRKPVRAVIFADRHDDKPVRIEEGTRPAVERSAVVVELTVSELGRLRGVVREQSLAHTHLYRRAAAARGIPVTTAGAQEPSESGGLPRPGVVQPTQFTRPDLPKDGNPGLPVPPKPQLGIGPTVIPLPAPETRSIWIHPRTSRDFDVRSDVINGERVTVVANGIKLLLKATTGSVRIFDAEADQVVIWSKSKDAREGVDAMLSTEGDRGENQYEFYFTGNVIIRFSGTSDPLDPAGQRIDNRTLRADRVYYNLENQKAIALNADVEFTREGFQNSAHVKADTFLQIASAEWRAINAEVHASRLPSDPGLLLRTRQIDMYQMPIQEKRTVFGRPYRDRQSGGTVMEDPYIFEASDVMKEVRGVPTWYWPFLTGDLSNPGPFRGVSFRQDQIFGTQIFSTWSIFDLIGLTTYPGEKWDLMADYLSRRGPAMGTQYRIDSATWLGMDSPFSTNVKAYGIFDQGNDIIGGPRDSDFRPSKFRGRFLVQHLHELGDFQFQGQIGLLSDRNFHEQYYKFDFDQGPNQDTFAWLKYQNGNFASALLFQPDFGRSWITETSWLPRGEVHWLGQSFLDLFTYHTWASAGYAQLDPFRNPTHEFPFLNDSGIPTPERSVSTGRFDWMQQLALPLDAGPVKVTPYGLIDLTYYTQDNNGEGRGRVWGGGGVRTSMGLSKLYGDVESDLLNLKGLYHKQRIGLNYMNVWSSVSLRDLPQLDRLNDDATEQSVRNVTPWHPYLPNTIGDAGNALALSPVFDPRQMVVRRAIDTKVDTLDSLQVLQVEWNHRFQTKRGYPGIEHTVDWLTLDFGASIFPNADRDNFGRPLAFLEYNAVWNVGDRNGFFSSAWVDPYDLRAKYWTVGTFFSRDDRTQYYASYREYEPIKSRLLTGTVTYVFSPKYAVTAVTVYDFGAAESLTNGLLFTRVGTDMQISFGFTYNALVNNFGFTFQIVPNLLASQNGPGNPFVGAGGNPGQDRR